MRSIRNCRFAALFGLFLLVMACFGCLLFGAQGVAHADTPVITGDLSLGTAVTTYRPVATPKQNLSSLMAQLELRADFGDFSLSTDVRHPFFNDRWGYWRAITAQFGAGMEIPIGKRGAALFARYERYYHNGFEWGWGGVRFPLRL